MTTPKAYQLETEDNGALNLACQKAAPYVAAARAMSTRRLYVARLGALGAVVCGDARLSAAGLARGRCRLPRRARA